MFIPTTIVLKLGPGVEPSWVEEKIEEEKTQWVDLVKNLVATRWLLFFLLKRRRFDLKKKLTRMTRSKPRTWALDRAKPENYAHNSLRNQEIINKN